MTTLPHFASLISAPNQPDFEWFSDLAEHLLNHTALVINGQTHRLKEIEFYYNGPGHEDPFTHSDSHQLKTAQWYFHREGDGYRGGSFKGLDISFGPEDAHGGILIRTIETPDGTIINGCSLCVDHMLKITQKDNIATLDEGLLDNHVWQEELLVHLAPHQWEAQQVIATARVGLTLKRYYANKTMPQYIMKPYRFLTDPKIKKGKLHTVIALHQSGLDVEAIFKQTRSPKKTIKGYIQQYSAGTQLDATKSFHGKSLKSADLARLHGTWSALFGSNA